MPTPASRLSARIIFGLFVLLVLALGTLASAYVYVKVNDASRAHILDRVATIAEAVPGTTLTSLSGSETDLESADYQAIKSLLIRVREANRDAQFVYLIGSNERGELFFYADSEDASSPDYSPPGQVYYEATPGMFSVLEDGIPRTEGPDQDRWGVWIAGYAPIYDASGTPIALLGMDLPAQEFVTDLVIYSALPSIFALVFVLLLFFNHRARARELSYIAQKSEFLAIASHEIRTPLVGMRWAMETLLKDPSLSESAKTMMTMTHDNALRLIARINNLLDMSALEARGKATFRLETVLVRELVGDVAASLALSAKQRGVTIELDPSVSGNDTILGDRQMLHHALFNLVGNAVKYTNEGTAVTLSLTRSGDWHELRVRDHGNGIAETEREKIFEGYRHATGTLAKGHASTGLGLYLTKKAAETHGGTVEIDSTVGEGSTFILRIPAK